MPTKKIVFTVYEAANGYFAETQGGELVVGTTLSEVCTAAQGKVAEEKMLEENKTNPLLKPLKQKAQWEKVYGEKFLSKFAAGNS